MSERNNLVNSIKQMALRSSRQVITGRDALVKNMFGFLCDRAGLQCELLLLCTKHGLIIDCAGSKSADDISGYTVLLEDFHSLGEELLIYDRLKDYSILSFRNSDLATAADPVSDQLERDLNELLQIFDTGGEHTRYLLECLNAVENSIAIYDKDAYLLFANHNFCKNLYIEDRDRVIGMHVTDIMKHAGIDVYATENDSNRLKTLDVLKTGKEVRDWEVRIESQTDPSKPKFTTYDMYPVLNEHGEVTGMTELAHSRQLDINRTKKIMGLAAEYTFDDIVGTSTIIRKQIVQAKKFANSPYNLLIIGESGSGKELFAQAVHSYSVRKKEPFVALNCASFPEGLIESELFGYAGGAFTGASKNGQVGKFELANGGTLFLDEIGELPYHFQSKLLRVLETQMVTRIGSSRQIPINVRVIAATNRNVNKMVEEKLFRQDLYYRLQVLNIEIPPLRERHEDILLLADLFLKQSAELNGSNPKTLDPGAEKALMEYEWPGNVRELKNVINRMCLLSNEDVITRNVLEASIYSKGYRLEHDVNEAVETPEERLNRIRSEVNASNIKLINEALRITKGNKTQAAELLEVSRKTFYRMLERYKMAD